ncbi:MAG: acyl-ACP--UDP-N-acetylglucosamine O-acyltransferase [Phycisphaerae bacterium]|nr:acyl-ACP--UDP-N-acetylglucosamine O-acyltransferase [Phycisphaerae bacterium]
MPSIHATAIVDRQAELADDVEVGPLCIIEGAVRLGSGTRLLQRVSLQGPLVMGKDNIAYPGACVGFAPQDLKFDARQAGAGTVIGDGNFLREGVSISRATGDQPTTVGHRNYLMAACHIGHDTQMGDDCMLANSALIAGHCELGDRVLVGGNAGVHQFARLGRLSVAGGASAITQDIPPFCVLHESRAIGSLNIVGLRRAGHRDHIKALQRAFDILFRQGHVTPTAADRIDDELGDDPLCTELAAFVRSTRRGITPYGGRRGMVAARD